MERGWWEVPCVSGQCVRGQIFGRSNHLWASITLRKLFGVNLQTAQWALYWFSCAAQCLLHVNQARTTNQEPRTKNYEPRTCIALNAPGGSPVILRKCRVKALWSQKPVAIAMSVRLSSVWARRCRASSRRIFMMSWRGVI